MVNNLESINDKLLSVPVLCTSILPVGVIGYGKYHGVDIAMVNAIHIAALDTDSSLHSNTITACDNKNDIYYADKIGLETGVKDIKFASLERGIMIEHLKPKTFVIKEMPQLDPLPFFNRYSLGHHNAHMSGHPKKRGVKHKRKKR